MFDIVKQTYGKGNTKTARQGATNTKTGLTRNSLKQEVNHGYSYNH